MKTRHLLTTACIGAAVATGAAQAQELDNVEIAYVGSWSSLSLFQNFEDPFWGEHVGEASDGRVTVDVTTFDQMGLDGGEVYRLLGRGVFDVGSTVANYTVQDAPELGGLDMPMIAPTVEEAREVAEAYRPVLEDIMAERFNGAKVLAVVPYPSQMVFCNAEIAGLDDLQGKAVRASGRTTAEFLEALDAEGITLDFSEVPGALDRGVVDCAVTGSLSGYASGWHEVSTHLYPLPVGGWDHVLTAMSGEKWNSIDSETQDWLLEEIAVNYEAPVWENAIPETEEGIACLTGEGECTRGEPGNMVLVEATEEDFEHASRQLEEEVLPAWAGRVSSEWVQRWNDTIGEVTGLEARPR